MANNLLSLVSYILESDTIPDHIKTLQNYRYKRQIKLAKELENTLRLALELNCKLKEID